LFNAIYDNHFRTAFGFCLDTVTRFVINERNYKMLIVGSG